MGSEFTLDQSVWVPPAVMRTERVSSPITASVPSIGQLLGGILDVGKRGVENRKVGRIRLSPTRSPRMNRALKELGPAAFKIHTLLWEWRGAPARGLLPFFTIHGLSKFCNLTRPTIRVGLEELVHKGWIQRLRYNGHDKNALYRLIPIRNVPSSTKK